MKYRCILIFILISFSSSHSRIIYDTTAAANIGPGIKYYKIKNYSIPWSINVIEADLSNKYISIETVKGGDKTDSLERTSSMARRNNYNGHKVIAATNADFWRNNIPIGIQISNHQFVKSEGGNSGIYFDNLNKPFIERISFSGTLIADGITANINNEMFQLNGVVSNGTEVFSFKYKIAKQNNSAFFYPVSIRQIIIKFGKNKNHGGNVTGRYYLGEISAIYNQN